MAGVRQLARGRAAGGQVPSAIAGQPCTVRGARPGSGFDEAGTDVRGGLLMLIITVPSPAVTARRTRRSRQPPCPKGLREAHPGRRGHAARPGAVPRGSGDGDLPGAVSADQDAVSSGRRRMALGAGVAAVVHAVAAPGEGVGEAEHVQGDGRADTRDDRHRIRQGRIVPDPRARPLPTAEGTGPARRESRTAVPDERARHRPGRPDRRLPGAARAGTGDGRSLHRRQAGHGLPAGDDTARGDAPPRAAATAHTRTSSGTSRAGRDDQPPVSVAATAWNQAP